MQQTNALSFKELKERISLKHVLQFYNLFEELKLKGKSHRGPCPFCEAADGTPFSVSLEKNCFQCFLCRASGNILDFVSKWEGVSIREASQILTKNLAQEKGPPPAAQTMEKITEREAPPAKKADPLTDEIGERSNKTLDTQTPAAVLLQDETRSENEPLTFTLKNIEPDHPSVKALGIQEDILTAFGVGYYRGRGMMGNRIVIPVYNPSRQLVAYAGFHPEERTYTYPPKFRRELELFNVSGALADQGADQGVILVRHPLEALMLISAGHMNAVAIMGDSISDAQVGVLLDQHGIGEKVTLFWPIRVDIVPILSELLPDFFVRLRRYEEKSGTPLGFTAEDIQELLV
jgi:DNA primase